MKSYAYLFKKFSTIILMMFLICVEVFPDNGSSEIWKTTVFGDIGSQDNINENNFSITNMGKDSVGMEVKDNKGKISGSTDGLMFYYTELSSDENFEISADIEIEKYDKNNQVSFGLMLRDEILTNTYDKKFVSDYLAVGAIGLSGEADYTLARKDGKFLRKGTFNVNPSQGDKLKLNIKKSGNIYVLKVGNEEPVIVNDFKFNKKNLYIGAYVARNAKVKFSNLKITKDILKVKSLSIDSSDKVKKEYLIGEKLDKKGLKVTAILEDGTKKELSEEEYIVTGFESNVAGKLDTYVNYNGVSEKISMEVKDLSLSKLIIKYYPAKTKYYKLDIFDSMGIVVLGEYNDGYKISELSESQYSLMIDNTLISKESPYIFKKSGNYKVTIKSSESSSVTGEFMVEVKNSNITKLMIKKTPEKIQYFIGDKINVSGIALYAIYDDKSEIRLTNDEFTAEELDSKTAGKKSIKIYHKNKVASLIVNVKNKEVKEAIITKYPKTTYYIGEKFNSEGFEISKLYDNGDIELINDYKIDIKEFNNQKIGEYSIKIIPKDGKIKPVILKTTVKKPVEYIWKKAIFGQSTTPEKNFVKEKDGIVEIAALSGGGKITGDHDGISFYYVELDGATDNFELSADIRVLDYAKTPHDGQESFGIMARDALGTDGDSALFASNIAAVGGFSGETKGVNGTQLFVRTGVTSPNGAGSNGLQKIMIKAEKPESKTTPYKLTLSKTNTGFVGKIDDGQEVLIYEPEILKVQNKKIYLGFFTARLAHIEVSNIELEVSSQKTDAPKKEKQKIPKEPSILIDSLDKVATQNYQFVLVPNVDGIVTIKKGNEIIANNIELFENKKAMFSTIIEKNKETNFTAVFTPKDTQLLTSYKPIVTNFTVQMKVYQEGKNIYTAPYGTAMGDGSEAKPLNIDTAIEFVQPGQTIIVKEGHYIRSSALMIKKYNNGTPKEFKKLVAEKGSKPVIDFDKKSEGVVHGGDYWYVYGIDFTNSAPNTKGYALGGNHNIIEFCEFYENGDTGMQISRTDYTINNIEEWPSYNLIKNCTSYNNADPSENNADGFAAKLTAGKGNVFDGCISHNNADDGWDLYAKVGLGKIGAVTIKNSVAYNNGFLEGKTSGKGDGNGFKMGGEGLEVFHSIENSLAFGNLADGFTSNSNPGVIGKNNIGINNKRNINLSSYTGIKLNFSVGGFKSLQYNNKLNPESDIIPEENKNETNYLFDGTTSKNKLGKSVDKTDVLKEEIPIKISRNSDGTIDFGFLKGN